VRACKQGRVLALSAHARQRLLLQTAARAAVLPGRHTAQARAGRGGSTRTMLRYTTHLGVDFSSSSL
jgi:hypothetical protein